MLGCTPRLSRPVSTAAAHPFVQRLDLSISNAYVVFGSRPILIDSGPPGATDRLVTDLHRLGIDRGGLGLVVLTHGHADHAGGAKRVRDLFGAPIAMGRGDVTMTEAGRNRPLRPMSFFARILRPFIDDPFPGFEPDIAIDDRLDLRPYGVDGVAIDAPGHTPGSVVVLLRDGDAFTGDLFAGGILGGALFPSRPVRHYYHDDPSWAERQVCAVIRSGAHRLFLGHGGPVQAPAAWQRFCAGQWDDTPAILAADPG